MLRYLKSVSYNFYSLVFYFKFPFKISATLQLCGRNFEWNITHLTPSYSNFVIAISTALCRSNLIKTAFWARSRTHSKTCSRRVPKRVSGSELLTRDHFGQTRKFSRLCCLQRLSLPCGNILARSSKTMKCDFTQSHNGQKNAVKTVISKQIVLWFKFDTKRKLDRLNILVFQLEN